MMKYLRHVSALFLILTSIAIAQQVDLSGLKICIDPGHGGNNAANDRHLIPDPGTDFWESESNFQKALLLKSLLEAKGATVLLTRNTNYYPTDAEPSLATRVEFANANNVDWFHSIHSNATGLTSNTSINYTLMLIREQIVPGGSSVYGPGTGKPETQEAWDISLLIGANLRDKLRTQRTSQFLDWTFYGGANGGWTLGVLRGLTMPGQLSEGSMHDYYPETRRLMNNSYRKMEAYAIRNAFLTYFGVPADSLCIVAGIQSEIGSGKLLDGTQVRILPENIMYNGDQYHNGFYMFDGIKPGPHTIRFETPGYRPDSVQITLSAGKTEFLDKQFESLAAPVVVTSTPGKNDTSFSAAGQIQITFSKIMDTASVRASFSIVPVVRGNLLWSNNFTTVAFKPDSAVLPFNTTFVIRVEGTARSQSGFVFDGNGDGTPGDAFQLSFRTQPADVWPPALISAFAVNGSLLVDPNSAINFTYDEPLDPSSVNTTNIVIQEVGGSLLSRSFEYSEANGRGGFNIYPQGGLRPGKSYRIRISGVKDLNGNAIPASNPLWTFTVASTSSQFTSIDDFRTSIDSWASPGYSGSTTGVDTAGFTHDSTVTLSLFSPPALSARLTYRWKTTTASDWLIREYLSGGPPRLVTWPKYGNKLQVYLFGDGSGTQFRFAVDDSVDAFPAGPTANHEVSQWVPIDWVGWRLIEWDLENDTVGSWIGNGKLEGLLRFDSFQLRYTSGSRSSSGKVYFTQLRIAKNVPVFAEYPDIVPESFELLQNYPNPFNPTTAISYRLSAPSPVSLRIYDLLGREIATLVNDEQVAGHYTVRWDGKNDRGELVSSGVYLYQLRAGMSVSTRKMVLLK